MTPIGPLKHSWPCDEFVAPLPLAALAILLLNDHMLKFSAIRGDWTTGKLSDIAGLFFFPLLLTATVNTTRQLIRRRRVQLKRRHLTYATVLTGLIFTGIKLSAPIAQAVGSGLSTLLPDTFTFMADPWDLLTLVVLPLSWRYGTRFVPDNAKQ